DRPLGVRPPLATPCVPRHAGVGFQADTVRALAPPALAPGHDQLDSALLPRGARQGLESLLQFLELAVPQRVSERLGIDPWRVERHPLRLRAPIDHAVGVLFRQTTLA